MTFESQIISIIGQLANFILLTISAIMCLYIVRHYRFFWNRMFKKQRRCHQDLAGTYTPSVSILIPMHKEERVASHILDRFVEMDYPKDRGRYEVIAINDGSTDATSSIIDEYASNFPFIKAIHRTGNGGNGKPEALNVGLKMASNEIVLTFDADYLPPRDCIKRLVAPFVDIEVGGVMGRVIPVNSPESLVTRLMDIERAGSYQINQQARYNLNLIPQFGGTVGGFRRSVLKAVGEFDETKLAEDTDLTYKLYLEGWKIAYVNAAECYEEAVLSWDMREKQLTRWAIGHNQCLFEHFFETLTSPFLTVWQKIDGILLLGVYTTPLLILIGWLTGIFTYLAGAPWWCFLFPAILFIFAYNSIGNFAVFAEAGGSLFLDQRRRSIWLLPLMLVDLLTNVWVCSKAFFQTIFLRQRRYEQVKPPFWAKTKKMGVGKDNYKALNSFWNNNTHWWDKTERSGNGMRYYNHVKNAEIKRNHGKRG
ncbi:MAG: glycosyltransferase family 2 protein [Candidatus Bathyarchaeota archaeon]|nr:glycosyltransferase family 2 protein [Candidatus Bathyarchaeota archaeon]